MFGSLGNEYLARLERLPTEQLVKRYTFTDNAEYQNIIGSDVARGMKIYWHEMLVRSHITAATSILRSRRWVDGIVAAANGKNVLAFAATLRGLIEAAGDTHTALNVVPKTLARDSSEVVAALTGRATSCFVNKELEDILIHYLYGRDIKKGEVAPDSHKKRSPTEYRKILVDGEVPQVAECYSQLCDLTHPGASSVWIWLRPESELELAVNLDQEDEIIKRLLNTFGPMFPDLFMFAFNGPLLTLATLNYFPLSEFNTPELKEWDFSGIRAWRKIQEELFRGFQA